MQYLGTFLTRVCWETVRTRTFQLIKPFYAINLLCSSLLVYPRFVWNFSLDRGRTKKKKRRERKKTKKTWKRKKKPTNFPRLCFLFLPSFQKLLVCSSVFLFPFFFLFSSPSLFLFSCCNQSRERINKRESIFVIC